MSFKESTLISKLLYVSKIGTSVSAAPIPQTHEHVHNVRIQWWSSFVDNVSSRTKV